MKKEDEFRERYKQLQDDIHEYIDSARKAGDRFDRKFARLVNEMKKAGKLIGLRVFMKHPISPFVPKPAPEPIKPPAPKPEAEPAAFDNKKLRPKPNKRKKAEPAPVATASDPNVIINKEAPETLEIHDLTAVKDAKD